jgi:hypothetical protein
MNLAVMYLKQLQSPDKDPGARRQRSRAAAQGSCMVRRSAKSQHAMGPLGKGSEVGPHRNLELSLDAREGPGQIDGRVP